MFVLQTKGKFFRVHSYERIIANHNRFPRSSGTFRLRTLLFGCQRAFRFLCSLLTGWTISGLDCAVKLPVDFTTVTPGPF